MNVPAKRIALVAGLLLAPACWAMTVVHVQEAEGPSQYTIHMDKTKIAAGKVKFIVNNDSKTLVHEFVVVRSKLAPGKLPYDNSNDRVAEEKLDGVGEVDDLKPGNSGSNVLTLTPGHYDVFCNEPGHYKAGMYSQFTVTR